MKYLIALLLASISSVIYGQTLTESWARSEGGSLGDGGQAICVDHQGGIYVAASFAPGVTSVGGVPITPGAVVIKYDRQGSVTWAKNYGDNFVISSIEVAPNGSIFIAGLFNNSIQLGSNLLTSLGQNDIFLACLDANGNISWAKSVGGSGNEDRPKLSIDSRSFVYLGGVYSSSSITIGSSTVTGPSSGTFDCFIAKFTPTGDFKFLKRIASGWFDYRAFTAISVDGNDNIHICHKPGNPRREILDSTGNTIISANIPGSFARDFMEGYKAKTLNDYLYSGQYINTVSPSEPNLILGSGFAGRTTSTFSYSWKYPVNPDYGNNGREYFAGTLGPTIPSGGVTQGDTSLNFGGQVLTSYTNQDIYVVVKSGTGITQLYSTYPNHVTDKAMGMAFDRGENAMYVVGNWSKLADTSQFRFGGSVLQNAGGTDMLLLKLGPGSIPLSVNAGPDKTICKGGTASIGNTSITSGGTGPFTYQWIPTLGLTDPTIPNPTAHNVTETRQYRVKVTDMNNSVVYDTVSVFVDSNLYRPEIVVSSTPDNVHPFCEGNSVTLEAISPLPSNGWRTWSNGVSSFNHSLTVDTVVTLTVRMTADNGCVGTSLPFTTVMKPRTQTPQIMNGDTAVFCAGGQVVLHASSIEHPATFQWNGPGQDSFFTASYPGTFYVRATGPNDCPSLYDSIVVIESPLPAGSITLTGNPDFCEGDSVVLTVNTEHAVLWNTGQTGSSIKVFNAGTYSATLTNQAGCSSVTNSISLNTIVAPAIPQIISSGALSFCEGKTITLTASSPGNNLTYLWNSGATTASIIVQNSGSFSAQAVSSSGCKSDPASVTTQTLALPAGSISAAGPVNFCTGDSVRLDLNTAATNQAVWNNNAQSNFTWVKTSGTYYVVLTSPGGCQDTTNYIQVAASDPPMITISQVGNVLSVTPSNLSYQWYLNDNLISGSTSSSIEITEGGAYKVTGSAGGCSDTASITAVMNEEFQGVSVQTFPNPTQGDFTVTYHLSQAARVELNLFDMHGQRIFNPVAGQMQAAGRHSYNLRNSSMRLQKGLYFVHLQVGDTRIIKKLIVF